jgi:hypothetical protein
LKLFQILQGEQQVTLKADELLERTEKELLIVFHEGDVPNEAGDKKKDRTAAIWTNYNAFVWTLQMLISKLLETGKKSHKQYVQAQG